MIIVDFLTLQMPGMLNRLSISIIYQPKGGKEIILISFEEAIDCQNQNHNPVFELNELPREIILPGLLLYSFSHFEQNASMYNNWRSFIKNLIAISV